MAEIGDGQSDRPNILLATTDQQRFDACGPFAPRWLRTPVSCPR